MMSVKVTMIGGGSSSFVPPLLRNFIESEELRDTRLTLMDVNADRLETMVTLAERLIDAEASPLEVTGTLDQREALTDTDFVIAAISVGGMDAWADDIEIPGPLRDLHERRGLGRPRWDLSHPAQRPRAGERRSRRLRGCAGRPDLQLHQPGRRSRRWRCSRSPARR